MNKFPENMKVGDTVEIVLRAKVKRVGSVVVETVGNAFHMDQQDIVSVEIVRPPLVVGGKARVKGGGFVYEVIGLWGSKAWLAEPDTNNTMIAAATHLEAVDG